MTIRCSKVLGILSEDGDDVFTIDSEDSVPSILPRRPHLAARQMSACSQQHPGCQLADPESRVLVVLSFELDLVVDAGLSDPVL